MADRNRDAAQVVAAGLRDAKAANTRRQFYNCKLVVDRAHQVIVAARSTNQPSDKGQAVSMIEETLNNNGAVP